LLVSIIFPPFSFSRSFLQPKNAIADQIMIDICP
jgi:hypothetical protein